MCGADTFKRESSFNRGGPDKETWKGKGKLQKWGPSVTRSGQLKKKKKSLVHSKRIL